MVNLLKSKTGHFLPLEVLPETREQVRDILLQMLKEKYGKQRKYVSFFRLVSERQEEASLRYDLGLDSLDQLEYWMNVESVFKVEFSDQEDYAMRSKTFGQQTDIVFEKVQERRNALENASIGS